MTKEDFIDAFMKGAIDAWTLAQMHPSLLEYNYLMARSANRLCNEFKDCYEEETNADQ